MSGKLRLAAVHVATVLVVVSVLVSFQGALALTTDGPGRPGGAAAIVGGSAAATVQADSALESGGEYWRGAELRFDGSRIVEDHAFAPTEVRTFAVWRVSDDGKLLERITRFRIDDDGEAAIPTAGYRGTVVVLYNDQPVYVRDGIGYRSSPPGAPAVTVENSSWRVTAQALEASWADRSLYDGQVTDLELRSDREEYVVAVTSEDLAPGTIERLFRTAGVDVRRSGNDVRLEAGNRTTVPVNFTGVGPDEYFFEFEVVDTTASAASQVTVQEPSSRRIVEVERVERTGDYLEATVTCEHCYLFVGGPGQGVYDLVELDDRNDDGVVRVGVNTRYAGLREGLVPSSADVYRAEGPDAADRFSPSDRVAPPDVNTHYGLGRVRSEIGLDAAGRQTPIPTGRYDLTVARTEYVPIHGGYSIRDEQHVQSVTLTEPSLDGMATAVLPNDIQAEPTLGTVGRASSADEIAVDDSLVLRIDVSGVFGNVAGTHDGTMRALRDNEAEGVDLTLSGPTREHRIDSISRLLVDEDRGRLYVVVDTGALRIDRPIDEPLPYRATFTIDGDAYPYLESGDVARATANVSLVERTASIESATANSDRVRVTGQSSLAPGSLVTVRVAADEPYSWSTATGVVVDADGSWVGAVDVRDAPGRQFSVSVHDNHRKLSDTETVTIDGSGGSTPTPSPTETRTVTPTTASPTTAPPTTVPSTDEPSTPGTHTPPPGTTTAPTTPSVTTTAPGSPRETTAPPTTVRTTTADPGGSPTPERPRDPDESGIPFAPDLPRLPTPVALAAVLALFGGIGGAAFLSRRP